MGRAYEVRKASMAKTAAAKTKVYSKYGKEIYLAAKNGVADPEMNTDLKRVIEKAKKDQVPNDIIKRAVDKAKSGTGEDYTTITYEGFGPWESTLIVECLTDNVNRSVGEVRAAFTKNNGKLGISGSVSHGYDRFAIVGFKDLSEDEVLEIMMENEVDIQDIEVEEDLTFVYGEPTDFDRIKEALLNKHPKLVLEVAEITYLATENITLDEEKKTNFLRLLTMLEEVDDVQNIYHNVEL